MNFLSGIVVVKSEWPRVLLISFSGGETSAYMTWWLLQPEQRRNWDRVIVVFANTGQENEQTLAFVKACDDHFGFGTVWIEGVQYHGQKKRPGFRIVDFETADRTGAVFEDSIRKYGIPNQKFKDCTRNLKKNPIEAYARSLGLGPLDYVTVIGIRADEIDRVSASTERHLYYPLAFDHRRTKPQINSWWAAQPFRLQLKGYQGNCKWCWKKSLRKHLTIMSETPEVYDFPARMEATYGLHGPEFLKDPATRRDPLPPGYRRVFFRGNMSVDDLRRTFEEKRGTFVPAEDEAQVFDPEFDVGGGCEETCEVDFTERDDEAA